MNDQTIACAAPTCNRRGEHLNTCTTPTCEGCWPRPADRGHLCQRHYERVDAAIQTADHLRHALHGIERAIRNEGANATPGPRLPLSPIRLDLEAIDRWQNDVYNHHHQLITRGYHGNLDQWISQPDSAYRAVRFAQAVREAETAHPIIEQPHQLQRTRCPDCRQQSFVWHPPTLVHTPIRVQCQNPQCARAITSPESIDTIAYIEATA